MEKIIISNWMPNDPFILESDLGWTVDDARNAMTVDKKGIFDYYWKSFFKIIFYYVDNNKFYELFMESYPHKFWEIPKKKDWDGKYLGTQVDIDDHKEGILLSTFDDDTDLWNTLKVDGIPIGNVLDRSLIMDINI